MNIVVDTRLLTISYDTPKTGGFRIMRGSSLVYTATTKKEAEGWIKHHNMLMRVVRFFYHGLKPTFTPVEREKLRVDKYERRYM